jgi:ribosomal protein S18 acetylase RimI-like enzyme
MVFDLYSNTTRVAVAVLVDRIQNPGNDACLEILGIVPDFDSRLVFQKIIEAAKRLLPPARNGIELTIHESVKFPATFHSSNALNPYYETYEMFLNITDQGKQEEHPSEIALLEESDYPELYQVLVESFKENPDTSIPSFQDWQTSKRNSTNTSTWVYKQNRKIMGFVNTLVSPNSQVGEIRTVGVLPEARGKGLGRILLSFAIRELALQGILVCNLTVAVKNQSALCL